MTREFITRLYRPSPVPTETPFGLRSVGHTRLGPNGVHGTCTHDINYAIFYWVVSGRGTFISHGKRYDMRKDYVAIFAPGQPSWIEAESHAMEYRFFTLDGMAAPLLITGYNFKETPFLVGPCPHKRFDALEEKIRNVSPAGERQAIVLVVDMLNTIAARRKQARQNDENSVLVKKVLQAMHHHGFDASIGVQQIADLVKENRSVMTRRFTQETGTTPKDYLSAMRLQRVCTLLKTSQLSYAEIAKQSGFSSARYMGKFFTKHMHMSPSKFGNSDHPPRR